MHKYLVGKVLKETFTKDKMIRIHLILMKGVNVAESLEIKLIIIKSEGLLKNCFSVT